MIKNFSQKGSAHVVIVIFLVVALLLTLGWVVWQNVANRTSDDVYDGWKTYTFEDTGTKFRYPSSWEVDYFSPSEEDGRSTASLLLTYDEEKVLAGNVTDSLWPSISIYDTDEPEPTISGDVIYTEKLSNSGYLVCSYKEGQELPGGPTIQRLSFDLVDTNFNTNNPASDSTLVSAGGARLIISGGNVGYQDGSLSRDTAKKLCESPQAGEYATYVIQWLKSIEF